MGAKQTKRVVKRTSAAGKARAPVAEPFVQNPDGTSLAPEATTTARDATSDARDATSVARDATSVARDATSVARDATSVARDAMLREIDFCFAKYMHTPEAGSLSRRVREALGAVPRHLFVPEREREHAYLNRPVPIGHGQTISQPFIVALMTELLQLTPDARVLEIGTGCGYQTAILARLARHVFTMEIVEPLAARAARTFAELGLANVTPRVGDGHRGWPEDAPFDAILVAAAPARVPDALVHQLRAGGRLVMPVGENAQKLIVVEKQSDQSTVFSEIIPVCFVPLTHDRN
ncbi:protein-L-isoaspartate(D-aspartate) O-methyltransferase [Hyphomicrobium sp.]|uniref:protein-L-isoaspartate(D-aspartate) O-methyltransferase n=1 Tax=Hyphomicrobium sp. TaxID=82 RepID=UPI003F6FF1D6